MFSLAEASLSVANPLARFTNQTIGEPVELLPFERLHKEVNEVKIPCNYKGKEIWGANHRRRTPLHKWGGRHVPGVKKSLPNPSLQSQAEILLLDLLRHCCV